MKKLLIVLTFFALALTANATMMGTGTLMRQAVQHQIDFNPLKSDSLLADTSIWYEFISRACIKVAMDLECVEEQTSIFTADGTESYLVDSAILQNCDMFVVLLQGNAMTPLKRLPATLMEEYWKKTSGGADDPSSGYWTHGDSIILFPTPVQIDTLLVGYSIYSAYIDAGSDAINIPLEYREAVVMYTAYLYEARVKMYDEAQYYLGEYTRLIAEYKNKEAVRLDPTLEPDAGVQGGALRRLSR